MTDAAEKIEPEPEPSNVTPLSSAPAPKSFAASILTFPRPTVTTELASAIQRLETQLSMPVWMLVQTRGGGKLSSISEPLLQAFHSVRQELPANGPIALLIDSPGGSARCAYQLAMLFRRHCGEFTAVIPRYAKSAATLLSLGASNIILGIDAELGPLDAQFLDPDREMWSSTLDEVQAFERLHARALQAVDEAMFLLLPRTGKKVNTLLPLALDFVAATMRPLLERIDTVHYSQMARVLKVAEEYAARLLMPKYPQEEATRIARHLVEHYPEHEFVIDHGEAESFGLQLQTLDEDLSSTVEEIRDLLPGQLLIGHLKEIPDDDTA